MEWVEFEDLVIFMIKGEMKDDINYEMIYLSNKGSLNLN